MNMSLNLQSPRLTFRKWWNGWILPKVLASLLVDSCISAMPLIVPLSRPSNVVPIESPSTLAVSVPCECAVSGRAKPLPL